MKSVVVIFVLFLCAHIGSAAQVASAPSHQQTQTVTAPLTTPTAAPTAEATRHEDTVLSLSHIEAMATVLALFFALLTAVVTYLLGLRQMEVSRQSSQQQIEASRELAQEQIEAARETSKQQMEASRELAQKQIEASLAATKHQLDVQLTVAKHQIIAPMRQAWIDKLRNRISSLIGLTVVVSYYYKTKQPLDDEKTRELMELQEEIILLLHEGESDHDKIADEVSTIARLACNNVGDMTEMAQVVLRLREISRKVFKKEWEVTKKMEKDTLAL